MESGVIVIVLSWFLNACMDAIDHGKGELTLNFLWHVLKWLSYALPFGYIMKLTHMPLPLIAVLILFIWVMWELTYHYLRSINFWKWDK